MTIWDFFFPLICCSGTLVWCWLEDIFEHFTKTQPLALSLLYCIFFKKHTILFSAPVFIISFFLVSLGIFCFCFPTFLVGYLVYAYQKHSNIPFHIHHIFKKTDNVGKHVERWQLFSRFQIEMYIGTTTLKNKFKFNMHILNASSVIFLSIFPGGILEQVDRSGLRLF